MPQDARQLACIGELVAPEPLAVTLFEAKPPAFVVEAYYDAEPALDVIADALAGLAANLGAPSLEAVPDENWVALSQRALPPVAAGRFFVHGSHDRQRFATRRTAIEIEAGEAFGTGHNATTALCLEAIDLLARRRRFRRVIDLGCGSGVLAIASARAFPAARMLAVDNDPLATAVARANARLNRVAARVRVVDAAGFGHAMVRRAQPFDLVLANILPGPLIELAPEHAPGAAAGRHRRAVGPARPSGARGARDVCRGWLPARAPRLPRRLDCAGACAAVDPAAGSRIASASASASGMTGVRRWRRGAALATLAPAYERQPGSTRLARSIYKDEHELFRKTVKAFIDREIAPHYERWEKEGQVSREVWRKAGEAGLLLTDMPEEYGGGGADFLYSAVMIEEMAKRVFTAPGFRLHSDIVAPYILNYGSEEQKRTWLPRMAKGEVITAIAMTEPGTGSDLQAIRTTALRKGNELVVNGQKTFITNGGLADLVIVAAKTDTAAGAKGVTLVLVETDRPGFKRGRNLKKIGQNAQDTAELFFEDVRVPPSNILGEEGRGFACLMNQLPRERLLVGIGSVAIMEAALAWTIDYTRERKAFGKAIAEFQNTRFKLAEVKTEVTVARVFLDHCLELFLAGELDATTAAMSKWWLTELDNKVLDTCLQLFGGYGYMLEYPIARAYADARVHRIYAGTTEIMKELVARSL